jgi:transposase
MPKTRRKLTAEFKARVALDALSGEHTLSELSAKYGVRPSQIFQWKKQAKEGVVASFSGKAQSDRQDGEAQIKELHAKIEQRTVEKDFLQQAFTKI